MSALKADFRDIEIARLRDENAQLRSEASDLARDLRDWMEREKRARAEVAEWKSMCELRSQTAEDRLVALKKLEPELAEARDQVAAQRALGNLLGARVERLRTALKGAGEATDLDEVATIVRVALSASEQSKPGETG